MSNLVGSLFLKLTANTTEFQTGMRRAERTLTNSQKQFVAATKTVRSFAGAMGLAVSAGTIVKLGSDAARFATRIEDVSKKLGVTTDFLQTLGFAARETGVRTEAAEMGMQRFVRRVGEAQVGMGELKDTLRQYNIQLRGIDGRQRDVTEIFMDYADAVRGAGTQQEKLRLAFKAFDSEGAALVTMLSNGSDGFADWERNGRKAMQIMDSGTIKRLKEATAVLERMKVALTIFTGESVVGIADGIDKITGALNKVHGGLSKFTNPTQWEWAKGFNKSLSENYDKFDNAITKKLFPFIGSGKKEDIVEPEPEPVTPSSGNGIEPWRAAFRLKKDLDQLQNSTIGNEVMANMVAIDTQTQAWCNSLTTGFENAKTVIVDTGKDIKQWHLDAADAIYGLAGALEEGLVNAARDGKAAIGDMAQYILAEINRVLLRAVLLRPLFSGIGDLFGGSSTAIGSAFINAFGGGRAAGGPVSAGRTYLVGEKGPELLTMEGNGFVTPNHALGGGPIFQVDMRGASVEAVRRLEALVATVNGSIESRAINAVGGAFSRDPGFMTRG